MTSVLKQAYFHDEEAAFAALEAIMWPTGKPDHCPHCGCADQEKMNRLAIQRSKPSKRNPNGKAVYGLWKCYACRQQFTVRKGTIFEESRLELTLWFQATYLMCSSKKGVSANQLHRTLGVTLKTAWFLAHRLREAMRDGDLPPMGGEGKYVEADTTYVGGREKNKHKSKRAEKPQIGGLGKQIVHTLVERDGKARSHHIANVSGETLRPILFGNVDRKSALMTDTAGGYYHLGKQFARHETVDHGSDEYVRGDAYSNTVEGYFSILKRGVTGIYHHVSERHLHRYLAEFDFRYNNRAALGTDDVVRTTNALIGAKGKRLTYRRTYDAAQA
ncbi:MAG: IS1595 family transposase [Devosia sp.]